ncbi:MAG TPA: DUF4350 domain-containing protein [Candidatus Thermoplasmatota archaeon]|nr:DUF4350 domain-containing protein [Candidatus Thermoplasmatota archaeon]
MATGVAAIALATPAADPGSAHATGPRATAALLQTARTLGDVTTLSTSPLLLQGDSRLDPAATLLVVAGATRPYSAQEVAAFTAFVRGGGHALVAEEDGHASALAAPLGLSVEPSPIVGPDGDAEVRATTDGGNRTLHARLPSPVLAAPGLQATPLASTLAASFVDRDGDGAFRSSDPAGPFTVAAAVDVGAGRLVLLGSLDLLSDRVATDPETQAWRLDLLSRLVPAGGRIILDESHHPQSAILATEAWVIESSTKTPERWILLGCAGTASVALLFLAPRQAAWGPHVHDPDRFRSRRAAGSAPGATDPDAAGPARARWTPAGSAAGAVLALLLVGGLLTRSAVAVAAAVILWAPLCAAGAVRRPRLEAVRELSAQRVPEAQAVAVSVTLTARRAGSWEVRDGVPAEDEILGDPPWTWVTLGRGRSSMLAYQIRPQVRGPHSIGPLRARAQDAFGLFAWDVPVGEPAVVKVLPRRELLKQVRLAVRRPDILMGVHPVNRAGEGSEFQALREYQAGDAMRTVNWRASARSKSLMVNQRVLESQTILTLVVDARAVSDCGPARGTPLSRSARAALTIAGASAQGRDRIRFFVFGAALTELPPAPTQRFVHEMGDLLASLPAEGGLGFLPVAQRLVTGVRPGTPVALFSGLEGAAGFPEGARLLLGRGASLTVFAFPVETSGDDLPDGEAKAIQAQRQANLAALRAAGAVVHDVRADAPLEALLREAAR